MGGTSLKRKARKNKTRAKQRLAAIKLRGFKPVIKSIDVEAVKSEFENNLKGKKVQAKAQDQGAAVGTKADKAKGTKKPEPTQATSKTSPDATKEVEKKAASKPKTKPKATVSSKEKTSDQSEKKAKKPSGVGKGAKTEEPKAQGKKIIEKEKK